MKRRMRAGACAWLCILVAATSDADPGGERLARLRAEIEQRERRAREWVEEAEGALEGLEAADRELIEIRRSTSLLRRSEQTAQVELRDAERAAESSEAELAALESSVERRLVALYKFEASGGMARLVSAEGFELGARRRHGLSRVLAQDRRLFDELREARAARLQSRSRAQALVDEISGTRREAALREERLRQRSVERRNLASLLRSRAERERRTASELRAAVQRLEAALGRLPREARAFEGGGLHRGAIRPPAAGPIRVPFGRQVDAEFGTQTLRNGVEIEAPLGSPVEAVAPGRVLFAGWFRGYGQMLILDHGEGDLTVLGYLDALSVKKGDMVGAGQEIGKVGETGSLSGAGLYFEIRIDGKPVDPQAWLRD